MRLLQSVTKESVTPSNPYISQDSVYPFSELRPGREYSIHLRDCYLALPYSFGIDFDVCIKKLLLIFLSDFNGLGAGSTDPGVRKVIVELIN